ncbi:MAG: PrsW family glutamic-type intramembrane protease [Patescibacteria group bacterium]
MTAALVAANISFLIFAFAPPLLWLVFYLREDCHPEPKRLLILAFFGGMAAALGAVAAEIIIFQFITPQFEPGADDNFLAFWLNANFLTFAVIGVVEEYLKYLSVKFAILRRPDFNEPIDAMIYMMTAALGFAALENILFVLPVFHKGIMAGIEITTSRFFGANLLHALSSGIVGFFLARAFFSPRRHHAVALGIVIAAVLHALFNYLIIIREVLAQGIFYIALLLSLMLVVVLIEFHNLRRASAVTDGTAPTGNG